MTSEEGGRIKANDEDALELFTMDDESDVELEQGKGQERDRVDRREEEKEDEWDKSTIVFDDEENVLVGIDPSSFVEEGEEGEIPKEIVIMPPPFAKDEMSGLDRARNLGMALSLFQFHSDRRGDGLDYELMSAQRIVDMLEQYTDSSSFVVSDSVDPSPRNASDVLSSSSAPLLRPVIGAKWRRHAEMDAADASLDPDTRHDIFERGKWKASLPFQSNSLSKPIPVLSRFFGHLFCNEGSAREAAVDPALPLEGVEKYSGGEKERGVRVVRIVAPQGAEGSITYEGDASIGLRALTTPAFPSKYKGYKDSRSLFDVQRYVDRVRTYFESRMVGQRVELSDMMDDRHIFEIESMERNEISGISFVHLSRQRLQNDRDHITIDLSHDGRFCLDSGFVLMDDELGRETGAFDETRIPVSLESLQLAAFMRLAGACVPTHADCLSVRKQHNGGDDFNGTSLRHVVSTNAHEGFQCGWGPIPSVTMKRLKKAIEWAVSRVMRQPKERIEYLRVNDDESFPGVVSELQKKVDRSKGSADDTRGDSDLVNEIAEHILPSFVDRIQRIRDRSTKGFLKGSLEETTRGGRPSDVSEGEEAGASEPRHPGSRSMKAGAEEEEEEEVLSASHPSACKKMISDISARSVVDAVFRASQYESSDDHNNLGPDKALEFDNSRLLAFLFSRLDLGDDWGRTAVIDNVFMREAEDENCLLELRKAKRSELEKESKKAIVDLPEKEAVKATVLRARQDVAVRERLRSHHRSFPSMWPPFSVPSVTAAEHEGSVKDMISNEKNDKLIQEFSDAAHLTPVKSPDSAPWKQRGIESDQSGHHPIFAIELNRMKARIDASSSSYPSAQNVTPIPTTVMVMEVLHGILQDERPLYSEEDLRRSTPRKVKSAEVKLRQRLRILLSASLRRLKEIQPPTSEISYIVQQQEKSDENDPALLRMEKTVTREMADLSVKRVEALVSLMSGSSVREVDEELSRNLKVLVERREDLIRTNKEAAANFDAFREQVARKLIGNVWASHHVKVCVAVVALLQLVFEEEGASLLSNRLGNIVDILEEGPFSENRIGRASTDNVAPSSAVAERSAEMKTRSSWKESLTTLRSLLGSSASSRTLSSTERHGDTEQNPASSFQPWHSYRPDHMGADEVTVSVVGLIDAIVNDAARLRYSGINRSRPARINSCCISKVDEYYNHVDYYRMRVAATLSALKQERARRGNAGSPNAGVLRALDDRIAWLETVFSPVAVPAGSVALSVHNLKRSVDHVGRARSGKIFMEKRIGAYTEEQLSPLLPLAQSWVSKASILSADSPQNDGRERSPWITRDKDEDDTFERAFSRFADMRNGFIDDKLHTDTREAWLSTIANLMNAKIGKRQSNITTRDIEKMASELSDSVDPLVKRSSKAWETFIIPFIRKQRSATSAPTRLRTGSAEDSSMYDPDDDDATVLSKAWESMFNMSADRSDYCTLRQCLVMFIRSGLRPALSCLTKASIKTPSSSSSSSSPLPPMSLCASLPPPSSSHVPPSAAAAIGREASELLDSVVNGVSEFDQEMTKLLGRASDPSEETVSMTGHYGISEAGTGSNVTNVRAEMDAKHGGAAKMVDGEWKDGGDGMLRFSVDYTTCVVLSFVMTETFTRLMASAASSPLPTSPPTPHASPAVSYIARFLAQLCRSLMDRYEFMMFQEEQLRAKVREQMNRQNLKMTELKDLIPEDKKRFLTDLRQLKNIPEKDLQILLRKGAEERASAGKDPELQKRALERLGEDGLDYTMSLMMEPEQERYSDLRPDQEGMQEGVDDRGPVNWEVGDDDAGFDEGGDGDGWGGEEDDD